MLELLEIAVAVMALKVDCAGPDRPSWSARRGSCDPSTMCCVVTRKPRLPSRLQRSPAAPGICPKRAACFFALAHHPVRSDAGRRPVLEFHAERQATLGEHFLDLGERLLAQVRGLEQLDFGLLDQVADVVDA